MEFRIGINLGDVIVEGERVYGDGVNIAARLEGLAEPGGVCLSGSAYDQVEGKLPIRFESLGTRGVKNIARPVRVYRVLTGAEPSKPLAAPATSAPAPAPPAAPTRPSIVVLPFANMSADADQEHLADGMTEDIITTLSKISSILVIASSSAFVYKGRTVDAPDVARELGVRHVLEGSIRRAGDRVRITVQLIDGSTGYHLWAERYERSLTDIFSVQDDIARQIVTELAVTLTEGEQARIRGRAIKSFAAWELMAQGLSRFRLLTREGNAQARELFEKAARIEGLSGGLPVVMGWTHVQDARFGWSGDPAASLARAEELAREGLRANEVDADAHGLLASLHLMLGRHDEAVAAGERAVALEPGIAELKVILAFVLTYVGRAEEAVALVRQAMRESPMYPAWYQMVLGRAYRLAGRDEEAVAIHEAHRAREPHSPLPYIGLVIAHVHLGHDAEAQAALAGLRALDPHWSLARYAATSPYKDSADLEREMDALRRAGVS
jgi:adenylate cyclase